MPAAIGENVFGCDGDEGAQRKRPENVGLRLDQQRQADPRDVGARDVRDTPPQPPRQDDLRRHADAQRRREPVVATEDAVARLAHHEHQRDEKDDQVFGVERFQYGSVITCSWSMANPASTCSVPDGQRIVTRPRRWFPNPKCSRRSFWLQNPIPPSTTCRCRAEPSSTVTSAPIALRLLRVPISLSSSQWPGAAAFLYSNALPFSLAITTSSTPRLNRSAIATDRPSSRSVTPASSATSTNPPEPVFSSTRERSYPERLAPPIGGQFFASSKMLPWAPAILDIAYQ